MCASCLHENVNSISRVSFRLQITFSSIVVFYPIAAIELARVLALSGSAEMIDCIGCHNVGVVRHAGRPGHCFENSFFSILEIVGDERTRLAGQLGLIPLG